MKEFIISVDLGGTKILSSLISSDEEIVGRVKVATDAGKGRVHLINSLVEAIKNTMEINSLTEASIKSIAIGVPGTVNPESGIIINAPNLFIKNLNIKEKLGEYFSTPVLIENDVNLAALGIQRYEIDESAKNVLVLFVGTGIGSALIFNGSIYRGSTFFAGEIGHMVLDKKGPMTSSGKRGTFEGLASRTAIVRDIMKDLKTGKKSILNELVPKNKMIKSKALAQAVRKKDPIATKHVKNACDIIGSTLANVTNLLNLDMIVLGGGVIEAMHSFMIPKIKASFKETVIPEIGKSVLILETQLKDDAALYGGITLTEEFFQS